jgi:hypothetical protein
MKRTLTFLSFLLLIFSCDKPEETIPVRSDWGIGMKILEPIEVCLYAKAKNGTYRADCYEAYHHNGTKFGIYGSEGYRAVDDTITPEFFLNYMDTVYLYRVIDSDTFYYQSKNLMDLNSYYLQPVSVRESGTQYFSFMIDVSSTDFY